MPSSVHHPKKMEIKNNTDPKRSLNLRHQDLIALQWVCEHGVMTVDQLWKAVWTQGATPVSTYRRVGQLRKADYLKAFRTAESEILYLAPTVKARDALKRGLNLSLPLTPPPMIEIPHSEALTNLRIAVQKARALTNWITDRILAQDPGYPKARLHNFVPDALWINPVGTRIFVEYERTRKGPARLREKLDAYQKEMATPDRFMHCVLWIAETASDTYQDLAKVMPKNSPRFILRTPELFLKELEHGAPK